MEKRKFIEEIKQLFGFVEDEELAKRREIKELIIKLKKKKDELKESLKSVDEKGAKKEIKESISILKEKIKKGEKLLED